MKLSGRVVVMIVVGIAWIALMVFAVKSDMAVQDDREALEQCRQDTTTGQAHRNQHTLIALRAWDYTYRIYSLPDHSSEIVEVLGELEAWLDSLQTGEGK